MVRPCETNSSGGPSNGLGLCKMVGKRRDRPRKMQLVKKNLKHPLLMKDAPFDKNILWIRFN